MDSPGRSPVSTHDAVFHSSRGELLAAVLPFLLDGAAAGEPTLVALGDAHTRLIRGALPPDVEVDFVSSDLRYTRPASAIREFRRLFAGHVRAGAGRIRVVGELPPGAFGAAWESWARYESAINHAYGDTPAGVSPTWVRDHRLIEFDEARWTEVTSDRWA